MKDYYLFLTAFLRWKQCRNKFKMGTHCVTSTKCRGMTSPSLPLFIFVTRIHQLNFKARFVHRLVYGLSGIRFCAGGNISLFSTGSRKFVCVKGNGMDGSGRKIFTYVWC